MNNVVRTALFIHEEVRGLVTTSTAVARPLPTAGHGSGSDVVELPVVDLPPPVSRVLSDPRVPEDRRRCGNCGTAVGHRTGDEPAPTEGRCADCGTPFSFSPKLHAGELVAGQYEVLGCVARGGLGWIYLARDRNLDGKYVALKGLINTGD